VEAPVVGGLRFRPRWLASAFQEGGSMIRSPQSSSHAVSRRNFLRAGTLGLGGLTLPWLLRARAAESAAGRTVKDTAVVWLFLSGGPSHLDTYDMKPDAPAEFRGPYRPLKTKVPGIEICNLLPRQTLAMDKMSVVRTLSHGDGNHGSAVHWVATGVLFPPADLGAPQIAPFPGSVAARVRGVHPQTGLPPYIALNRMPTSDGPAYLGVRCAPFEARGPGKSNLSLHSDVDLNRLRDRRMLMTAFDTVRRDLDATGAIDALDRVDQQAFDLLLGRTAHDAYDLGLEHPGTVERYGPGLGQQMLTARRLCEAGTAFVTIEWSGNGKRYGWDNHRNVFKFLDANLPELDHAVATFVEDVAQRGISKRILLVVMREMGRTPKINANAGRDHWPQVMFAVLAGGGLKMGQVVGRSSARAEVAVTRPLGARDLLATIYHVLGIDLSMSFTDASGRPLPLLLSGQPIAELV
jgi:hypothetical protein